MYINFYGISYLKSQIWADNPKKVRDKDNLKLYRGKIVESKTFRDGSLVHDVEYEKGRILVPNNLIF
ncbi:MAG: hypothetical protein CMH22_05975 [Methylophaga sp.]|nr:hypothetical protein [Methylophaga sp.]|tara:strand:+ start:65182 stop:65382 length:201 start_codon:yes stop_codon:yes gene_type:complete